MRISPAMLVLGATLLLVPAGRSYAHGGGGHGGGFGGGGHIGGGHFGGGHFGGGFGGGHFGVGGGFGGHGGWNGGHEGWHGGHGGWHGGHGGWYGGVYVGSPWWWDPFDPFPDWYDPGYYAGYPPMVEQQAPPTYVQQAPAPSDTAQAYWYYCPSPKGYYPKVPNCPEAWIRVPPSRN